ncbi:hypothetical protein J1N10_04215 [Carboxylicivirga sp. A043]|uniref:hypothetical protein n=1 Tax=Carboxylicivirga litoralis TaxID=2816963 RepID=UPI0021CB7B12|nr:hypothetical protein [Carboxylicivirga sp. A043]MCU4155166.1 hypothetical protein [Carboxylicivirga sp. A043]
MKYTSLRLDAQLLFMDKTDELTKEIQSFLSDLSIATNTIVKVECYASVNNQDEYTTCLDAFNTVLTSVFNKQKPAKLFIAQSLADDAQKALFKFSICDDKEYSIEYKEFQKHPYCLVSRNEENILISGGISFDSTIDTLRLVQSTFDFMEQLLDHEEMHFGHVAYQANFINDIQSTKKDATTGWTKAQTIDEIRALYFDPNLFRHGYPLQHNSHISTSGFIIDFMASSKDGFPTAQYNLNTQAEQTQNCFIPGLKKLLIKPQVNHEKTSCELQLKSALNTVKTTIDNCGKEIDDMIDEIKVTISDKNNLDGIEAIISDTIKTNKLVLFHSPLQSTDLKVDIEVISSVIC